MGQTNFTNSALLIVDVQEDFTGNNAKLPVNKNQAKVMIDNLNKLIDHSNEEHLLVVYIGNEYSKNDIFNIFRNFAAIKGTAGIKIDNRLKVINENYFSKQKGNAFSNPNLDKFLKEKNISNLIISGLYAEACIFATLKGAINNHYKTTVLKDCIATKNESKRNKMIGRFQKLGAEIKMTDELF